MSNLDSDQWILTHSPIDPKKLHAMGLANYRWNAAEIGMKAIYTALTRKPWADVWPDIHDERDKTLCKAIRKELGDTHFTSEVRAAVLHAIEVYDRNRENRNQLSHFLPGGLVGSDLTRLKGPTFDPQPIADGLPAIRRVVEEIEELLDYLSGVFNHLWAQVYDGRGKGERPPLPDKPALPAMLWTETARQPKPKGPPTSSRG